MEWAWIIIIFALCGGWGGNWGGNNGGGQMMYDLGRVATTNDVASDTSSHITIISISSISTFT